MSLYTVPLQWRHAVAVIQRWHRHHDSPRGHLFSIGAVDDHGTMHGVAVIGRPVARGASDFGVAEVTRLATDGTPNVCSLLYGAARRACFAMGYWRVITYTLPSEGGASLRAAGWTLEGEAGGRQWTRPDGSPRRMDPLGVKWRWAVERPQPPIPDLTAVTPDDGQLRLDSA